MSPAGIFQESHSPFGVYFQECCYAGINAKGWSIFSRYVTGTVPPGQRPFVCAVRAPWEMEREFQLGSRIVTRNVAGNWLQPGGQLYLSHQEIARA